MSETHRIQGLVTQIVSNREVILNRGTEHGLKRGSYVAVLDPNTESVRDPETGDDLGGLRRIKAVLRVVDVAPKIALAQTFRTRRVRVGGGMGMLGMANTLAEPKYETRIETLQLDPQISTPISAEDSAIATKDPFEVVTAEEAEDARTVTIWR